MAPKLRVISRFGVGFDTLDIPACTRKGVLVGVVNGANDLSVAEHAMMLMLAMARRTRGDGRLGARRHLDDAVRAAHARTVRSAACWWSAMGASAHGWRSCAPRSA